MIAVVFLGRSACILNCRPSNFEPRLQELSNGVPEASIYLFKYAFSQMGGQEASYFRFLNIPFIRLLGFLKLRNQRVMICAQIHGAI